MLCDPGFTPVRWWYTSLTLNLQNKQRQDLIWPNYFFTLSIHFMARSQAHAIDFPPIKTTVNWSVSSLKGRNQIRPLQIFDLWSLQRQLRQKWNKIKMKNRRTEEKHSTACVPRQACCCLLCFGCISLIHVELRIQEHHRLSKMLWSDAGDKNPSKSTTVLRTMVRYEGPLFRRSLGRDKRWVSFFLVHFQFVREWIPVCHAV